MTSCSMRLARLMPIACLTLAPAPEPKTTSTSSSVICNHVSLRVLFNQMILTYSFSFGVCKIDDQKRKRHDTCEEDPSPTMYGSIHGQCRVLRSEADSHREDVCYGVATSSKTRRVDLCRKHVDDCEHEESVIIRAAILTRKRHSPGE